MIGAALEKMYDPCILCEKCGEDEYCNRCSVNVGKKLVEELNKDEYTYILGYIEVNGHDLEVTTNKIRAGVKIIKDSIGYMICEKIDSIENETHTLFIGKLIHADVYKDEEAMSYQYPKQSVQSHCPQHYRQA